MINDFFKTRSLSYILLNKYTFPFLTSSNSQTFTSSVLDSTNNPCLHKIHIFIIYERQCGIVFSYFMFCIFKLSLEKRQNSVSKGELRTKNRKLNEEQGPNLKVFYNFSLYITFTATHLVCCPLQCLVGCQLCVEQTYSITEVHI